jgi:cell division protein FtsL
MFHKMFTGAASADAQARSTRGDCRVPVFANDDIYFFVKHVDNSRVVRAEDPEARGACWKMIGSVVAAAVLLVAVLLPSAYSLLAGYQVQSLKVEAERLETEHASLELKEAALLSPARMEELARMQQFIDPAPDKVVYLDGAEIALNRK